MSPVLDRFAPPEAAAPQAVDCSWCGKRIGSREPHWCAELPELGPDTGHYYCSRTCAEEAVLERLRDRLDLYVYEVAPEER